MLPKILKSLASTRLMAILLAIYIIALAAATFIESAHGTPTAQHWIYKSAWFIVFQIVMVINFAAMAVERKMWRSARLGAFIMHAGFVVVLLGALTTFFFGSEGYVHLREGETTNKIINNKGVVIGQLPFDIKLEDFILERYSGSGSPSSFESRLVVDGKPERAYMNNVVHVGQWRIYQSSYDSDMGGSVLSVNRDFWGTIITYAGYIMLLLGGVWALAERGSRFRALLRKLAVTVVVALCCVGAQAQIMDRQSEKLLAADLAQRHAVPDTLAKSFGKLMVQTPQGRIEPMDTYARELLRKFTRKTSYNSLTANQVLLGILSQGQTWARVPFIEVGNDKLRNQIGLADGEGFAYMDAIDTAGQYRLQAEVDRIYAKKPNERDKYDKEVLKLDEKINILNAIFNGQMLAIFPVPNDPGNHWLSAGDDMSAFTGSDTMVVKIYPWFVESLQKGAVSGNWDLASKVMHAIDVFQEKKANRSIYSPQKIEAELLYNRLEIFKWCGYGMMTVGLCLIISVIISLVTTRKLRALFWVLGAVAVGLFLAQSFAMGLRWYISERAPWTNAYESMVYVGWATILGGLIFARRSRMTFALASFLGGVILFVTNLSWMDPQITPLVPVLKSYWLVIHVAVITGSYGFFGIGFLLGFVSLLLMAIGRERLRAQISELVTINELALWLGLLLMTFGTFLGAVWANESWGRYWGWDPKETWALVTVMVYAFVLHARLVWRGISSERWNWLFSVMSVVALGSVLMTFFGVNYYLTGLHSYGGDSAPPAVNAIWVCYVVVLSVAAVAYFKVRRRG